MCDVQVKAERCGKSLQDMKQADTVRAAADADDQRNRQILHRRRHDVTLAHVAGNGRRQSIFLRLLGRFWGCGALTDHAWDYTTEMWGYAGNHTLFGGRITMRTAESMDILGRLAA